MAREVSKGQGPKLTLGKRQMWVWIDLSCLVILLKTATLHGLRATDWGQCYSISGQLSEQYLLFQASAIAIEKVTFIDLVHVVLCFANVKY